MSKLNLKNIIIALKNIILLAIFFNLSGCNQSKDEYNLAINQWHQLRIDSLKGKTGFINLVGLYWLDNGITVFGADSTVDLDFTQKSSPVLGAFLRKDSVVYLIPYDKIFIDGKLISDTTIVFKNGKSKQMNFKSLSWFILKNDNHIGVRLRDYESPLLNKFHSIDYFETNPTWRVEAVWKPYKDPIEVSFLNILGRSIKYSISGSFSFTVDGKEYELEPLGEPENEGYFVMFYDKTSGKSTYGSGRYIYVQKPNKEGRTLIDFNKAFNPPCAFTEFATCLFPHKKNRLPIYVNAGEKFANY